MKVATKAGMKSRSRLSLSLSLSYLEQVRIGLNWTQSVWTLMDVAEQTAAVQQFLSLLLSPLYEGKVEGKMNENMR